MQGVPIDRRYGDMASWRTDGCNYVSFLTPYEIDCPDESFDVVMHGQVLEHVAKIWHWVRETARVLKIGGKMIVINPVSWGYYATPIDCWRIYPEGMRALFDDAGIRCDFSTFESLSDGVTDTISLGTKVRHHGKIKSASGNQLS